MAELRVDLRQPGPQVFALNHYTLAAPQLSLATKDKLPQDENGSTRGAAQKENIYGSVFPWEDPRGRGR